ncbi:ribosome maturation factor RimP [Nitrospirales bacterium NOB]|nr:Ribosome maturation factor RimP [Nitrospirota bacterium]MCE7965284.1 ribosome maturation factor RimP [Nitrospira sp. NTP2]MCK6494293.1 ribosome maturation factor RimP [Nitrospira sp.]MDL1888535.1 ribosome maturation factor RimP [Nitrospirales bacterium NOB]MEB2339527.1 ribosome maturation factor RimP [Nitrospirales bacterium]
MSEGGTTSADKSTAKRAEALNARIQELAAPILQTHGLELVEVACVGQGSRTVVRVFIDKPGGITLTDCEQAHRSLSPALDVIDPFPHAYTLEISSPGLDRPLRKIQDYRRVVGHPVNIKLREPLNGQWRLEGTLAAVEDDAVTLTIQQKKTTETVRVAFDHIALARRSVEF